MNKQTTAGDTYVGEPGTDDSGFTLVEILIAIVLIGVLSAVAVVGVNSLTSQGSDAACDASLDAAKAASVVYFAANDNTYPEDFTQLTSVPESGDAALEAPTGVEIADDELQAGTWTLTMTAGKNGAKPAFACGPAVES